MNESTRAYIYRIAVAIALVAVGYGIISEEQTQLWLQALVAVLAIGPAGLASANTSITPTDDRGQTNWGGGISLIFGLIVFIIVLRVLKLI